MALLTSALLVAAAQVRPAFRLARRARRDLPLALHALPSSCQPGMQTNIPGPMTHYSTGGNITKRRN
jgi:hypothetical protein